MDQKNVEWDMRVCTKITISIVELVSNTAVAIGLAINDGLVWSAARGVGAASQCT